MRVNPGWHGIDAVEFHSTLEEIEAKNCAWGQMVVNFVRVGGKLRKFTRDGPLFAQSMRKR